MNPRIIAWEITRRCPLACRHCRAGAQDAAYDNELSFNECLNLIDSVAKRAKPMLIFTGGEPMYREDLAHIVAYATARGLRCVLAPCGKLVTTESLQQLQAAGIEACSFSIDGSTAKVHDAFRGIDGAFAQITNAARIAKSIGMPFQINTAVSKLNAHSLPAMRDLAIELGASMLDFFFLVPVGRGKGIAEQALAPDEAEAALRWIGQERGKGIRMRVTCAPQSVRVWNGEGTGCLGGKGFVFVSHTGTLQPCGFLDLACGNVRTASGEIDFWQAYDNSEVIQNLNKPELLKGSCGRCAFGATCGGCRARAYAATGDYLQAEPTCPLATIQ